MTRGDVSARVRAPVTMGQLAGILAVLLGAWTFTDRACPVAQAPAAIEKQRTWAEQEFVKVRAEGEKAIAAEQKSREEKFLAMDKKLDKIQAGVDDLVRMHMKP